MNYSYIRVSTEKQTVDNQRFEILNYCKSNNISIDREIAVEMSTRKSQEKRKINHLLDSLNKGDMLVVSELSRLGRKTAEIIILIDELLSKEVTVVLIKQSLTLSQHNPMSRLMITMLSAFSELERDLISQRTKEALAARKAKGVKLGRKSTGKYEQLHSKISMYLKMGYSVNKIAFTLDVSVSGLRKYTKRAFKEEETKWAS
jgi:DNA invertase Pin-like site-specific DNA recombinase